MTTFYVFGLVIAVIVTIHRVRENRIEQQKVQQLEQQLLKEHQNLSQFLDFIDYKREDLGIKVRYWFMIQPCSRCHEFKMKLLEISPNGRSVHYQCANCNKKIHAPAGTPDAPQITEVQSELSNLIDEFGKKVWEFRMVKSSYERQSGRAMIEDVPRLPEAVFFESPAAPLPYEQTTRTAIPEAIRSEVWRRDSGKCVQCGSNQNLQFDHIIPVSRGGATSVANVQLLCQPCNGSNSNRI